MTQSQTAPPGAGNRRGIFAMSASMGCFVANDALVKVVSESLPSTQLIFVRGLFASLLLLCVLHAMGAGGRLGTLRDRKVMLRAGFDAFATVTYLTSLFHLPIATATAINMASPLFITAFAVIAFHERVGPGRWLAISAGFAGVLLIVQPRSEGFNAYALLCLAGTLLHAGRDLTTRVIDRSIPAIIITFSTALAVTLLTGFATLFVPWQPVTWLQLGRLAAASVLLSGGYFLIIVAMRAGEMSVVAPFRYTGLLFALVLGYALWGDLPNGLAWLGIALMVGAGWVVLQGARARA
jgi:drug/metabolite transporter (DMT)-like permease